MWRYAARHQVSAILLCAVPIGVAGLTVSLVSWSIPVGTVIKVSQNVLLILTPTLVFAAACHGPRGVWAARRLINNRRAEMNPQPSNPPIEQIAADLRRLL